MIIKKVDSLLNDEKRKKQSVIDSCYKEIISYIEKEMITVKEFHNRINAPINYNYFRMLLFRSEKKLSITENTKKIKSPITNKENNNSNSNKIKMNDISDRLLNEISGYGFNEDDIRSWFDKNDFITSSKLRKKFNEIKSELNNKYK